MGAERAFAANVSVLGNCSGEQTGRGSSAARSKRATTASGSSAADPKAASE